MDHKKKKLPPLPPLPVTHHSKPNKYNETKFVLKSPPSSSALADGGPSIQPTSNTYQSLTNYNNYYKYEKFSSASENFVKFTPTSNGIVLKVSRSERNLLLILGTIQMTCGLLMVVFAILAILHDSALSSFAAGIWSGAMSLGCGFVGVVAGVRSCYHTRDQVSLLCLTIYLALGLINIAVDNLALVIASTGLLRDAQRPTFFVPLQEDDLGLVDAHVEITNWAPVLSNLGLVITLTVECLVSITSVLKCYRHVCVCSKSGQSSPRFSRKERVSLPHPDSPANSFCSSNNSKQKLVRHWLGHQTIGSSRTVSTVAPPAPSPVFICAPAPFYTMDGRPLYPIPPPPPTGSSLVSYLQHPPPPRHSQHSRESRDTRESRDAREARIHKRSQSTREPYYERRLLEEDRKVREEIRRRKSCAQYPKESNRPCGRSESRPKKPASAPRCKEYAVSEEDVEKTYTGLDREIAEEFICAVMEPSSHHRQQLSDDDQSSYR